MGDQVSNVSYSCNISSELLQCCNATLHNFGIFLSHENVAEVGNIAVMMCDLVSMPAKTAKKMDKKLFLNS